MAPLLPANRGVMATFRDSLLHILPSVWQVQACLCRLAVKSGTANLHEGDTARGVVFFQNSFLSPKEIDQMNICLQADTIKSVLSQSFCTCANGFKIYSLHCSSEK
jgi:hypothetical protein